MADDLAVSVNQWTREWLNQDWLLLTRFMRDTWLVWVVPLLMGTIVGWGVAVISPLAYPARGALLIHQARMNTDYTDVIATKALLPTLQEIAQSESLLNEASRTLGNNWTAELLRSSLELHVPSDSTWLEITVRMVDAEQARAAVDAVMDQFIREMLKIFPGLAVERVDEPVIDTLLIYPVSVLWPVGSGLIGLVFGGVLGVWWHATNSVARAR